MNRSPEHRPPVESVPIIACRIMEPEVKVLKQKQDHIQAFYLDQFLHRTPGWISEKKDPLSIIEETYVLRYGREMAEWAKKEARKHSSHLVLVDSGVVDLDPMRRIAMNNTDFFGMEYQEIKGKSTTFFRKLVKGPYSGDAFVVVRPGADMEQESLIG